MFDCWLVGWLVSWLVVLLVGFLVGWLVRSLVPSWVGRLCGGFSLLDSVRWFYLVVG